jgi:hypothetical protein
MDGFSRHCYFLLPPQVALGSFSILFIAELKKGGHHYDLTQIREQLSQALRPLLANTGSSLLDKYPPIPDKEPKVTEHVRALWRYFLDGTLRTKDYTAKPWSEVSTDWEASRAITTSLGRLVLLTLVDRSVERGQRSYRYRLACEKHTLFQTFVFDGQDKIDSCETEALR